VIGKAQRLSPLVISREDTRLMAATCFPTKGTVVITDLSWGLSDLSLSRVPLRFMVLAGVGRHVVMAPPCVVGSVSCW